MRNLLIVLLSFFSLNGFCETYNVLDYGIVGDNKTVNTKAIQALIDKCSETKGTIVFPAGDYVTGTIFIKSNVHINLMAGATLFGSTDLADYPFIDHKFPTNVGEYAHHALVYANSAENFSIFGGGQINGNGKHPKLDVLRESDKHMLRPYMIQFVNCKNIRMQGIELFSPSFWLQHYLACTDVFIDGIYIQSHGAANNDGLDIDDCKNMVVSNCIFDCEDDVLCFKSTTPVGTDNVTITNCVIKTNCNAIKFGTDSHTAFTNINISNITINEPAQEGRETFFGTKHGICGIAIEAVDGTLIDNMNFSNIVINNTDTPFYIKIGDRLRKSYPEQEDKVVRDCKNMTFSNITVRGISKYASSIMGIPTYNIENIFFDNIVYETQGFTGFNPDNMLNVPENSKMYPSPEIYGVFPAHTFYVRHANNVSFKNMKVITNGEDSRHAFVFDDVRGIRVGDVDFKGDKAITPIRLINSTDAFITGNIVEYAADNLVQVEGKSTKGIMVSGNNARNLNGVVKTADEVKGSEIFQFNNWSKDMKQLMK